MHSRFHGAERGNMPDIDWLRHLNDAKFAVKKFDQTGAQKSLAALEEAITVILHDKETAEETHNTVAMTPGPPARVVQAPNPLCVACGRNLRIKRVSNLI